MDSSADYARRVRARPSSSSASDLTGVTSPQYRHHSGSVGVDQQLLAHTGGYSNVRSGDMGLRLEQQLDTVLGVSQDGPISHLSAEAAQHYNPADLAGWIECMICDMQPSSSQAQLHTSQQQQQQQHSPTPTHSSFVSMESSLDSMDSQAPLQPALPSAAAAAVMPDMYPADDISDSMAGALCPQEDTGVEESGVRLVHLLLACAEAVQRSDVRMAEDTVRRIQMLATPQRGPMGKVAAHFVEALARRIFGISAEPTSDPLTELLHFQFYETCPYLKFAHFTANQAILEAVQNHKRIHVIDCNLMHGLQWPALIQALALRPGGPPILRLTGIGPPHQSGNDVLQEIGMKLAQLADLVSVQFEFRGVYAQKLDDVKPYMLHVRQGEAVAVNAVMQLHRLLHNDNNCVPAVHEVLQSMRSLNPKIVTLVEHEANHNSPVFLDRFMEALHYYSTMFDSLEACSSSSQSSEQLLAEMYVGREICNIVACEGFDRVERHENLVQWRRRMTDAGFQLRHLGSNAFKQASMLLTLFPGDGYRVEENNGCLTLGWHSRPLIAASAWHCS
ncbi:DELLA protein [Marchantia polymorpha subsp. ruderalis]|uniref:Transcriptional factor DELLA N-terminal domain-containing protein n=2 Tax=Marchantia polymorpha TaxID=3197 RepID=A0AAF6BKH0_MARPO|nr:hypothetical protein MARPO_0058s0044 [Marchantia polymorpha]BAP05438.1 GAI1-like E3 ubiquitin ligase protein [Marchantia polymorpha]BBN12504.1 hypothetical protein Mp_5g20660 [Marchantia polymorpha subsp. ruderalis]|eukprot:PTQ37256.1 hypothetical protein MARPO_0058s0044 [Marchantia polymorpha]